ncbi:hypothetical protein SLA2020_385920 [Shorea laevis]
MVELSLDLGPAYLPKTMSEFLGEVSKIGDGFQRLSMIDDYLGRLEDEMRKIDAFKRELPLCMLLLNDAIGRLKEEEMRCKKLNNRSVSEEISPLKRNVEEDEISDKKNWMSSVQLWNSDISYDHKKQDTIPELNDMRSKEDDLSVSENPIQLCNNNTNKGKGGTFVPFKGQSEIKQGVGITDLSLVSPISELDSCNSGLKNNGSIIYGSLSANHNHMKVHSNPQEQLQQQPQNSRKQRRCWSPDLHRRFVDALQQLGGSQVATPKQIRELMQVDGLTNDEVKSHLQKYRLHVRKLPAAEANDPSMAQEQWSERMKASVSKYGSPKGPLLASGSAKGTSSTGGNSMEAEEDEKSDGQSWRGGVHKSMEIAL